MKKLISMLLVFAMILGSINTVFAAGPVYQLNVGPIQESYNPGTSIAISGAVLKDAVGEANVDVTIIIENKVNGAKLWTKQLTTQAEGAFSTEYAISAAASNADLRIKIQSCGITKTLESLIRIVDSTLTTDKATYYEGETVNISGKAYSPTGEPLVVGDVAVELFFGNQRIFARQLLTNATGIFRTTYVINSNAAYGTYVITAHVNGRTVDATFNVIERPSTGGGGSTPPPPSGGGGTTPPPPPPTGGTTTPPTDQQVGEKLSGLGNMSAEQALPVVVELINTSANNSPETVESILETATKIIEAIVDKSAQVAQTGVTATVSGTSAVVTVDSNAVAKALSDMQSQIQSLSNTLKASGNEAILNNIPKQVIVTVPSDAASKEEVKVALDSNIINSLSQAGATLVLETKGVNFMIPAQMLGANSGTALEVSSKAVAGNITATGAGDGQLNQTGITYDLTISKKDANNTVTKVTSFNKNPMIEIPLTGANLAGKDVKKLGVYVLNEATNQWEYVYSRYDAAKNALVFTAPHFSIYSVIEFKRSFADIPATHWAKSDIEIMAAKHITNGVGKDSFAPEKTVTRAEFAVWAVRALGLTGTGKATFADIPSTAWYANDVALAADYGIVGGVGNSKFDPNANLTREQMAVIVANAYKVLYNREVKGNELSYNDKAKISSWAVEKVKGLTKKGIMNGTNGYFRPSDNATRAEALVVLKRILN